MSYIYILAGENLELAEAELNGFLESQEIDEKASRRKNLAETEAEPMQLKRLGLTHEVSRKISEASKPEKLDANIDFSGSFAVRAENLTEEEKDTKKIEKELGRKIESEKNSVDLENPKKTFKAYLFEEKIVLSELVQDIDRGLFMKRKNDRRPFSSPVSLDPVLARVLVNLSGVRPGKHLLDPFCGTGGILIEAGLCGVGVHGRDIDEEMIEGAGENLENYGIINYDIERCEISEVSGLEKFDAIVTDLPYGQASKKTSNVVEDFLEVVESFEGEVVFMYNEASIGGYEADYSVYVHKNLTRYIFTV
ncbi:methyltransferase domain-containing protein [Candidatus Nanosalina sp. VS9-1]|uniref:methyltransferase domain-containing protein n=1 Tax=Candidatus Nanosalina sp. VS9-1 TaxID=3388566 RepID=UPI0039E01A40